MTCLQKPEGCLWGNVFPARLQFSGEPRRRPRRAAVIRKKISYAFTKKSGCFSPGISSRSCVEEIEKMTSEEEIEAEAQHKVTALDRLQMVNFFMNQIFIVESMKFSVRNPSVLPSI